MKTFFSKQFLPTAFWLLSALEAFATLWVLLRIPADPKNSVIAGFSAQRLVMFSASWILALLFLGLAWASAKDSRVYRSIGQFFNDRRLAWCGFFGLLAAVVSGWLLIATPPNLQGAFIERIRPYLILMILLVIQGFILYWQQDPARFRNSRSTLQRDFANPLFQSYLGYGLLLLSFLIGLSTVFFTYYNLYDEGDTLTVGWLISEGRVLYRDIFSHHFPFPYLWVGVVMRLFGPSILSARLSLVVLRTLVFFGAMKFSRKPLLGGVIVFAWSLISPLFLGNMLMYDSFGALLLSPAILVVLTMRLERSAASLKSLVFVGVMIALAGLSDPVTIAPGLLLLILLFVSGIKVGKPIREQIQPGFKRMGIALLSLGITGLLFLIYFSVSGALGEFYRQAVWFNQAVYSKYAAVPKAVDLFKGAMNSLDVFNSYWVKYPGIYYQWYSYAELDQWIFSGLFFRLAVIGLALFLLLRRRFFESISVYLIGSMLLWRAVAAWHAQAFMLFSVVCATLLIHHAFGMGRSAIEQTNSSSMKERIEALARAACVLMVLPIALMFLWLTIRTGQFWIEHRAELPYQATFSGYEGNGAFYRSVTCHQPDASILIIPGRMLDYLAAQLPPATRYTFLFPWVADVAQDEVIEQLLRNKDQPVMVFIDKNIDVWGYPVEVYLDDLIQVLDQNYVQTEENIYISPGLQNRCENQAAD